MQLNYHGCEYGQRTVKFAFHLGDYRITIADNSNMFLWSNVKACHDCMINRLLNKVEICTADQQTYTKYLLLSITVE